MDSAKYSDEFSSEETEEFRVLQAQWLKLVRATEQNEPLALERSRQVRYMRFLCCRQEHCTQAVQCDKCFGWIHQACMAKSERKASNGFYKCSFCEEAVRAKWARIEHLHRKALSFRYSERYADPSNDGIYNGIEVKMPEKSDNALTQVVSVLQDKVGGQTSGGAASPDRRQKAHNQTMLESALHTQLQAFPSSEKQETSAIRNKAVNA